MATPSFIYPYTSADGEPIPDSLLNPSASYIMPFTSAAMGAVATLFTTADDHRLVQLIATKDCQLGFTDVPVGVPANNVQIANSFIAMANIIYQLALPSLYLSAIGLVAAGTLYINKLNPWNALGVQIQFDHQ